MENFENIIETMIGQHRALQKDLGGALALVQEGGVEGVKIKEALDKFTVDLTEHLTLENDTFYPELLKRMKAHDANTAKTEEFINSMKAIGEVVMAFLGKYKEVSTIDAGLAGFAQELGDIIPVLNLRIESEESGVYGYWGLYN